MRACLGVPLISYSNLKAYFIFGPKISPVVEMKKECIYDSAVQCPVQKKIDISLEEVLEKACPYCWKLKAMAHRPPIEALE